jgi:hypothetical protein
MAVALTRVRERVRERCQDTDNERVTFDPVQYDQAIADAYIELGGWLPAHFTNSESAFTISQGASTFTLPATVSQYTGNDGGAEYTGDIRIRLRRTGRFLTEVTMDEMDAIRDGEVTINQGEPRLFAPYEEKDQGVKAFCYPAAEQAEVCDLFHKLMTDDLRDFVGSGTDDMDDVEILFSRLGTAALVSWVAAEMLDRMTDEQLAERKLNRGAAGNWRQSAVRMLLQEESRLHDLEGVGRLGRWVG